MKLLLCLPVWRRFRINGRIRAQSGFRRVFRHDLQQPHRRAARDQIVEMGARARGSEALESAVDLSDPLQLVVAYTRSLYGGLFFQPRPNRVLMIGLGGAGFHRLFAVAYPGSLLHTVELDPMVFELCRARMQFKPTPQTPVTIMDGRMFVKRDKQLWDWLILDAFRGGFVPPHLKTEEFYRECAARPQRTGSVHQQPARDDRTLLLDVKTIQAVFPQVVVLNRRRGNVAFAVKYREPSHGSVRSGRTSALQTEAFAGRLDLDAIRAEHIPIPKEQLGKARVLSDDFAPWNFSMR